MTDFGAILCSGSIDERRCWTGMLYNGLGIQLTGIAVSLTLLGSIIPDIDIHSSIPRRWLGVLLIVTVPLGAVYFGVINPNVSQFFGGLVVQLTGIGNNLAQPAGLVALGLFGVGAANLLGYGVDEILTHRGITHTLSFGDRWRNNCRHVERDQAFLLTLVLPAIGGCFGGVGVIVHVYIGDS